MFRKALSIFLAFFVIGSVPGFTLFIHYCNGSSASEISLWADEPCHISIENNCCKKEVVKDCCKVSENHNDIVECKIESSDCCETQIVKANNFEVLSYRPAIKIQNDNFGFDCVNNSGLNIQIIEDNFSHTYISSIPDFTNSTGRDINIRNCVYRL